MLASAAAASSAVGLGGFAMWASSRWDVLLHLLLWVVGGSFALGFASEHFFFPTSSPAIIKLVAGEILDVLPQYKSVLTTAQFLLCVFGLLVQSGNNSGSHTTTTTTTRSGGRLAWLVFLAIRVLFPVVSACENDVQPPNGQQSVLTLGYALYCAFAYLSFVGPLATVQSRCFCLADLSLYVYFHTLSQQQQCDGTQVALLAACAALAHDFVVHLQLFVLIESVIFSSGLVWAAHVVAVRLRLVPVTATTDDRAAEAVLSALLLFWSLGMFLRTFAQGRVPVHRLAVGAAVPVVFAVTKSASLAAACAVVCWGLAKQASWGKRKAKPTRNSFALRATGLFTVLQDGRDLTQDRLDREEEEERLLYEEAEQAKAKQVQPGLLSFEEAVSQFHAFSPESFDSKAVEEARAKDPNLKTAVETREDLIHDEHDKQRYLSKKIFYLEALSHGQWAEEQAATVASLKQHKQDLKDSQAELARLLAE